MEREERLVELGKGKKGVQRMGQCRWNRIDVRG